MIEKRSLYGKQFIIFWRYLIMSKEAIMEAAKQSIVER